jgi:hypothetical protein
LIGNIIESAGRAMAWFADGSPLGTFSNRQEAFRAISARARI